MHTNFAHLCSSITQCIHCQIVFSASYSGALVHFTRPSHSKPLNNNRTCCVADIGKHGSILIIRHFVNGRNTHDHILYDCALSAGDCCCELISKFQPTPALRCTIDRNKTDCLFFSSLLRILKTKNVICAYFNNEFHVNVCHGYLMDAREL